MADMFNDSFVLDERHNRIKRNRRILDGIYSRQQGRAEP